MSSRSLSGAPLGSSLVTAPSLDVAEADDYLLTLLLPRFMSMYKYLETTTTILQPPPPWVLLALLQGATIWTTRAQTPATRALGLEILSNSTPQRPTTTGVDLGKWIVLSVVLPTIHRYLQKWYHESNRTTDSSNSLTSLEQVAWQRKQQLVKIILDFIQRTIPVLRLYSLLSWWMRSSSSLLPHHQQHERGELFGVLGGGDAPGLAMRLAGLSFCNTLQQQSLLQKHEPTSLTQNQQSLPTRQRPNVTYAHRRWLYDELLRTVQIFSPASTLQGIATLYAGLLLTPWKELWERIPGRERVVPRTQCPICHKDPICIPYVTNCGHAYCYTCLWTKRNEGNNRQFRCRVCRQVITSSERALPDA